ncbi:RNA recognition motif domain-containing protein [Desulfovibrio ferrophilus]|uniref:RRM domain-containing RNA-binding protein n=1 Tax=Desulfovibrio ferrophilus TaxID=241368 RepID=A0A2Z6AU35_9BACT|nr:RNA-binding protein [Desulfovibrio ferrophilus]BBD06744.1 RRM domain-containing RNA-binding protein [Desulfovibrio ferrophilus]
MSVNLFVGNLPFSASEDDVRRLFEEHGPVSEIRLVTDRFSGTPRGFGFVIMDAEAAKVAQQALDGIQFCGRTLRVDQARDPQPARG